MSQLLVKTIRLLIVLLLLSMLAFGSQLLLPGDPAELIGFGADPELIDEIRADLKLDDPIPVRYAAWLGDFVQGDLGEYYRSRGGSPSEKVQTALPISLTLMVYTQLVALALAIPLGVIAAYRANKIFDKAMNVTAFLALSIPGFVFAFLLKKFFSLDRSWLPESGWIGFGDEGFTISDHLRHAVLPVISLALAQVAVYFRLLRSDMIATLQEDFITMAKAKGLSTRRVLFRHALRPSSLTLLTVAGLNVGTMISSAVLIENIFQIPGMGLLLVEGVLSREYIATQSFVAIVGIIFVLINYAVDFLYTIIDPRIRHA